MVRSEIMWSVASLKLPEAVGVLVLLEGGIVGVNLVEGIPVGVVAVDVDLELEAALLLGEGPPGVRHHVLVEGLAVIGNHLHIDVERVLPRHGNHL